MKLLNMETNPKPVLFLAPVVGDDGYIYERTFETKELAIAARAETDEKVRLACLNTKPSKI